MDRNQSWFHGTTAGIIHHFKDPLNTSLKSDQNPGWKKTCKGFGALQIFPRRTVKKEMMT